MRVLGLLIALALPCGAFAQSTTTPVPQRHIPPPVLMELRALESQFDLALRRDCAPERCVSKGCLYRDHAVVDLPRNGSLPGLGQTEGPGSVPAQEYLTQAYCSFAHEKSVSSRDVQALVKRLEQRLTRGWLQVTVGHEVLEPISAALSESPPLPPEPKPPEAKVEPAPPAPPAKWEAEVALRELWVALLPHFSWMIAVVLLTLATLFIIWGLRRLGRETLEEKALAAQLAAGGVAPGEEPKPEEAAAPSPQAVQEAAAASQEQAEELAFLAEQRKQWNERIAQAQLADDEGGVVDLMREWLKGREFDLLAKAIFVFGDRLSLAFPSDGELAVRKVEFAEYLRNLDEKKLPKDADFFRTLNHHVISSSLLSQSDAESYRSLREEFGSSGIAHLVEALPARHGALLFGLVTPDCQDEVARLLSPALRLGVASQLLLSNRISREEQAHIFHALDAARSGKPLPPPPAPAANAILDRGREIDAPGALSMLFPHISAEDRVELFGSALKRASGAFPGWYQDILYPDMLLKLPQELRADLLLEVDVRGLAGWSSLQQPAWQESFLAGLTPTVRNAVRANMAFASRAEQLRLAHQGRVELASGIKRLVTRGKVSFSEIVA